MTKLLQNKPSGKERRKKKNNNRDEKTERKQKGFRLKSETLIIIRKDKTKTERFPTKVGNLNNTQKTEQKHKGLPTKSGRP